MSLLHKFTEIVYGGRLIPKLIWEELTNLDTRISAMDGAGETELTQLENSDNAADIIVAGATKVADWKAMSGDATIAYTGVITIEEDAVDSTKIPLFVSTEQTGNGSAQNVAHGLGVEPATVMILLSSIGTDGATYTYTKGTTNVIVTATTGAKYFVVAIA